MSTSKQTIIVPSTLELHPSFLIFKTLKTLEVTLGDTLVKDILKVSHEFRRILSEQRAVFFHKVSLPYQTIGLNKHP